MIDEEVYDGEIVGMDYGVQLTYDHLKNIKWRTKEGELIKLSDMEDKHLRNTALMLMGLGYQRFRAPDDLKVMWLIAFKMEWERRRLKTNAIWRVL